MSQKSNSIIISQHQVGFDCYRLKLTSELIADTAQPGQFVHILTRAAHIKDPLLRRAFSILSAKDGTFEILYKTVGKGTREMALWQKGQEVDVIGPLGKPFEFQLKPAASSQILLVGGGVGVPPLAMLAARSVTKTKKVLVGARNSRDVMCREDFLHCHVTMQVATEDGSEGHKGLVTDLLRNQLEHYNHQDGELCVYTCGPLPMLRAVAMVCLQAKVPCQISLEENMPCGIGICNGCVVPVNNPGDAYSRYRRVCVEGPVMWAQDVDWSHWEPAPSK